MAKAMNLVVFRPTTQQSLPPEIHLAPRLQAFLFNRVYWEVHTWLGMFGGKTPKGVKLISDDPFIEHLRRTVVGEHQSFS